MLYYNALQGAVAQLGEHLLCKQGVAGSIPVRSTLQRFVSARDASEAARVVGSRCDVDVSRTAENEAPHSRRVRRFHVAGLRAAPAVTLQAHYEAVTIRREAPEPQALVPLDEAIRLGIDGDVHAAHLGPSAARMFHGDCDECFANALTLVGRVDP